MELRLGWGERVGLQVDSVDFVAFLGAFLGFRLGVKAPPGSPPDSPTTWRRGTCALAEDGANSPATPLTLFALDVSSGKLRYTADWPAVNVVDWVAHARIPAAPALAVDE